MPHFENLDQYEAENPESGKRHIVPIAPHSLQAADYRPGDEGSEPPRKRKRIGEFRKMDFEPVSIQQMEKEFKAAGRKRRRTLSKHKRGSFWKKLLKSIKSLFGKSAKKPAKRINRDKSGDTGQTSQRRGQHPGKNKQQAQGQKNKHSKKQHSRKPRNKKGQTGQQQPKPRQQQVSSHSPDAGSEKSARKRSRRNRRRRPASGQQGNSQSGNQQQG